MEAKNITTCTNTNIGEPKDTWTTQRFLDNAKILGQRKDSRTTQRFLDNAKILEQRKDSRTTQRF